MISRFGYTDQPYIIGLFNVFFPTDELPHHRMKFTWALIRSLLERGRTPTRTPPPLYYLNNKAYHFLCTTFLFQFGVVILVEPWILECHKFFYIHNLFRAKLTYLGLSYSNFKFEKFKFNSPMPKTPGSPHANPRHFVFVTVSLKACINVLRSGY